VAQRIGDRRQLAERRLVCVARRHCVRAGAADR
jgi:hypothetical protein